MNFVDQSKTYLIRRGKDRGHFDHGWLNSYHTFSFGDYYDPDFMGFRTLRVINEDIIAPKEGFPLHPHKNMEIITVMLDGELAHKDSMENEKIIREHEIQVMSAGSGVTHSEYNPSATTKAHLLQIWITPDQKAIQPRYQQVSLPKKENDWILLTSKTGENGSLLIQQDAKIYMLTLTSPNEIKKTLGPQRYGWLQIIEGEVNFNAETLYAGDGVALNQGVTLTLSSKKTAKLLLFDLN